MAEQLANNAAPGAPTKVGSFGWIPGAAYIVLGLVGYWRCLKRHPRRTVRELISLLDKEFRWKTTESAVTNNLYTRRDKFAHTQADRATNRPVTWSFEVSRYSAPRSRHKARHFTRHQRARGGEACRQWHASAAGSRPDAASILSEQRGNDASRARQ
jgi:hypothetical protein